MLYHPEVLACSWEAGRIGALEELLTSPSLCPMAALQGAVLCTLPLAEHFACSCLQLLIQTRNVNHLGWSFLFLPACGCIFFFL